MRLATLTLLTITLATSACNRQAASTNGNVASPPPETGLTAQAASSAAERAVATSGEPQWREITIPSGTSMTIALENAVGSDISRVEERVMAHLTRPVEVEGVTVIPDGSPVVGIVTDVRRSGKVKGLAHLAVRFDTVAPKGSDERYAVETAAIGRTAPATKKKDAVTIGAPAVGGAIVGGLIGGKKGALIGTAAGGGGGTAVVLSTRGKEVRLGKGAPLTLRLTAPLTVKIRS